MTFQQYLNSTDFLILFNRKILPKKGGGRDNVSPETYKKTFEKEIEWIKGKLSDGSYKFSPYQEKLILKGKGRLPRVISLPSVRDRFVLCLLNGYLTHKLGFSHMIPNLYITRIADFVNNAKVNKQDVYFFKTDISAFFDNIDHSVLFNSLADKIDGTAMKLVMKAITTPTISTPSDRHNINNKGVPQGLAISNILAAVYVARFHMDMKRSLADSLFLRYVDDIIILSTKKRDFKRLILECLENHNLRLQLTDSKTIEGNIEDGFDFLGYKIKGEHISVKKKNRDNFSNRLAKRCILLRRQFKDPLIRPRFTSDDKEFLDFAETDLNLMISGFKTGNHNYGWIAYFQRINDLTLLHQIDKLVKKCIQKELGEKITINSIVDTYFDLMENGGENLITDLDKIIDRGRRIAYLRTLGYIKKSDDKDISNEEVDRLFNRMISNLKKHSELDISVTS